MDFWNITRTPYIEHKLYIAENMGYGLGSESPEEMPYYNKVKKDLGKDKYTEKWDKQ